MGVGSFGFPLLSSIDDDFKGERARMDFTGITFAGAGEEIRYRRQSCPSRRLKPARISAPNLWRRTAVCAPTAASYHPAPGGGKQTAVACDSLMLDNHSPF